METPTRNPLFGHARSFGSARSFSSEAPLSSFADHRWHMKEDRGDRGVQKKKQAVRWNKKKLAFALVLLILTLGFMTSFKLFLIFLTENLIIEEFSTLSPDEQLEAETAFDLLLMVLAAPLVYRLLSSMVLYFVRERSHREYKAVKVIHKLTVKGKSEEAGDTSDSQTESEYSTSSAKWMAESESSSDEDSTGSGSESDVEESGGSSEKKKSSPNRRNKIRRQTSITLVANLWRKKRYIALLIFFETVCEVGGSSLLLLRVIPKLSPTQTVSIIEGLAIMSILTDVVKRTVLSCMNKSPGGYNWKKLSFGISIVLLQLSGLLLLSYGPGGLSSTIGHVGIEAAGATVLLSATMVTNVLLGDGNRIRRETEENHRYGISFIKSIISLVTTALLSYAIGHYTYGYKLSGLWSAFSRINSTEWAFYGAFVASALISFHLLWLAMGVRLERLCFFIPVFVAPYLSVGVFQWMCNRELGHTIAEKMNIDIYTDLCPNFEAADLGPLILLSLSFLLAMVYRNLWAPLSSPLPRERYLFHQPLNPTFYADAWMAMQRFEEVKRPIDTMILDRALEEAYPRGVPPAVRKSARASRMVDSGSQVVSIGSRIFVALCFWREEPHEMRTVLQSLAELDDRKVLSKGHSVWDVLVPEGHIVFDNALLPRDPDNPDRDFSHRWNPFVWRFWQIAVEEGLTLTHQIQRDDRYGQRLQFAFKRGMILFVYLKDTSIVLPKKRWNQVLYYNMIRQRIQVDLEVGQYDHFLLALDGDTQCSAHHVNKLAGTLTRDPRIGAVCGRIFPKGDGLVARWQEFEYALGHWFQKTTEAVLSTVLCCPGAFTMYRMSALDKVMDAYSVRTFYPEEIQKLDQGEDRYLTTLLVSEGYVCAYDSTAKAGTYCPVTFNELFSQRRRWIASTAVNMYHLVVHGHAISRQNSTYTRFFRLYVAIMMISTILAPATVAVVLIGGLSTSIGLDIVAAVASVLGVVALYIFICMRFPSKTAIEVSFYMNILFMCVMAAVIVGLVADIIEDVTGPDSIFVFTMTGFFMVAYILHISDFSLLNVGLLGVLYALTIPTAFIMLILFSFANIHDQSWGTRDAKKTPEQEAKAKEKASEKEEEGSNGLLYPILANCCEFCWGRRCMKRVSKAVKRSPKKKEESEQLTGRGKVVPGSGEKERDPNDDGDEEQPLLGVRVDDGASSSASAANPLSSPSAFHPPQTSGPIPQTNGPGPQNSGAGGTQRNRKRSVIVRTRSGGEVPVSVAYGESPLKSQPGGAPLVGGNPALSPMSYDDIDYDLLREKCPDLVIDFGGEATPWEERIDSLRIQEGDTNEEKKAEIREMLMNYRKQFMALMVSLNAVFIIAIMALSLQSDLQVLDTNLIGLILLIVFAILLAIQVLAMIVHRFGSVFHDMALRRIREVRGGGKKRKRQRSKLSRRQRVEMKEKGPGSSFSLNGGVGVGERRQSFGNPLSTFPAVQSQRSSVVAAPPSPNTSSGISA